MNKVSNLMKRSKKGSGHLEMIFSFVFFVGFVFFLFLTLKPYDTISMPRSINLAVVNSFQEKTSTNLTSFFLKVNYPQGWSGNCFYINLSKDLGFEYGFANSYANDLTGKVGSVINSAGKLEIDSNKDYFMVLLSPEFSGGNIGSCAEINSFEMGSILNREVLSYKFLKNISDEYISNYELSKERLGVPPVYDFAITSDGFPDINMYREAIGSTDVIATSYVFEVLKDDGNLTNSKFTVKIW
jgi:hypothetical protein